MKFGLFQFSTDYSLPIVDLARAAEDHGFESLWLPEHTHMPLDHSPWPGGAELPREYSHSLDPFVGLAAAAAVTRSLVVATGVSLVPQHDPITLAKTVASLDHLSNGRLILGIGGGWNRPEIENHGVDPKTRWRRLREQILAMKAIWTNDAAEFHGQYVDFNPLWSWPKPVQKPHPPIAMGGDGPTTFQRLLEYGDEWVPIPGRSGQPMEERIAELNRLTAAAGRAPIPVSICFVPLDAAQIERYAAMGVTRCIFRLPPAPAEEALPVLKQAAELVRRFA